MTMMLCAATQLMASALAVDFATGSYQAGGFAYASAADIAEVVMSGAGGVALTPSGALQPFADNTPRIVSGVGMLLEPESRNIISGMNNAAPTTTAGWTLLNARPAGATLTVVDDPTELYNATDPVSGVYIFRDLIDAGLMNGMVVRAYNPSATDDFAVPIVTLGAGTVAFSAYVRCTAGSGFLSVTGGGGATPDFSGASWRRVGRSHVIAASGQVRMTVRPESTVYIILAQLEPGNQITSPIIVSGTAKSRRADKLKLSARHWFGQPHTAIIDVEIARQDGINRQMMTLSAANGKEMVVLRQNDNTLSATQSDVRWRPRLPRVYGPGRVRFAHRVSARGRTLGCGGLLAHDPFRPAPRGLDRMIIGSAADGSNPMSGWVRSIEIMDEVDDETLEALVAPPSGSIALDIARFVKPSGNDANDGKTPATAWRTLAKAADSAIVPLGAHIHLERGGTWAETLLPLNYCTYRPYGSGPAPVVGPGRIWGIDENSASAWRVQDLLVFGATQRGLNAYGGSGIMVHRVEFSHCGDENDNDAIGVSVRGNTRTPLAIASAGAVPPAGATVTALSVTELVPGGAYSLTCTQGGAGTASRWRLNRPDGTTIGTASGNTAFSGLANAFRFTVTDSGADPVVGESFAITVTELTSRPYPTNALAEDFYVSLCHMHHIAGAAAGDDVYCEGVQGVIICEGNIHEIPIGRAADCFQAGRNTAIYVEKPGHVICRNNYMSMDGASTSSGKGGIVIIAGSALVEGNWVWGLNFCIGVNTDDCIIRWNYCEHARYQNYSWGIGIGGNTDVSRNTWYENTVVDCNRAYVLSGTGNLTLTPGGVQSRLQYRPDVIMKDNIARNCGVGVFIDRPWSGMIYRYANDNVTQAKSVSAAATVAPGGAYSDQIIGYPVAA